MKLDVERLRQKESAAVSDLMKLCQKYAGIGSRPVGALEFADDIAQEMCLKLISEDFLDGYNPEQDIDGWMIGFAKNKGLEMRRKYQWGREIGSEFLDATPAEDDSIEQQWEHEESVRKAETVKEAIKRTSTAPQMLPQRLQNGQLDPRWQRKMRERPDVRTIAEMRKRFGFKHVQLARFLGVTVHHLRALLYGRVVGNPARMLEKLKAFEAEELARHPQPDVGARPIREQMERWRDRLGLERGTAWHLTIGEALGVNRATAYRWRSGRSQPYPYALRIMDCEIERLAESNNERTQEFGESANGHNAGSMPVYEQTTNEVANMPVVMLAEAC